MRRVGVSSSSGPSFCPYSPKCLELEFCELRLLGILGSSRRFLQEEQHRGYPEEIE
jgi:hypothetical protein